MPEATRVRTTDKLLSASWAFNQLNHGCLILDTETTGLHDGEIIQIAVIEHTGRVLLDSLVKPVYPIPPDASAVHGLYDADVANAPGWSEIAPQLRAIIEGKTVVVYNAVYDRKMMHQSAEKCGMDKTDWKTIATFSCAMEAYAQFWGDWNDYHRSYRWQRLTTACLQQGIPDPDAPAHSALGDCLRTLALMKAMAASYSG